MIKFTIREIEFLQANEGCRVATCTKDVPHIAPVTYYFEDGYFYFATDYDTKKYTNLKKNNKIAISVDIYSPTKHKAVIVQGLTILVEKGPEFKRLYDIFYKKFAWVRENPWKEGEAPFVKITPKTKTSWGLG
ncbi:MAG: pyridoxamine 5'-phosphate oxidase [Thaumarchaeota archaeon 13_1_40CM_38_12]|nr:MAG: pyridoxamine 5'-phosphate oxidase [Thaumarchaeota archaeon 13_1_40CM_38_12]OLC36523.1 MAG: pyridoxamine 5'-phosphate oxidase [Thaumarchaeota archaeon 13_1_40CM_4_38_7]OLC93394.1 MAG: pyridoxamine 5'-phosphate oxidase [Thaumarchaeota archaeon 13_1_40CM_3_38_6]OLD40679.1 MAG: pyridoxamine 5'-phosphate oxidase [Thaumarchaeota archaeon 13_1_40CM_2_39_4]